MEKVCKPPKIQLSKVRQVGILRRDGWLCCWCKKPVIFAPVMKYLELEVRSVGHAGQLAYYHAHWTRDGSPLLDELGAVIDHVEALARGGSWNDENLCTACAKCNGRKGDALLGDWIGRPKPNPVKGKFGEPQNSDGLSTVFITLAKRHPSALTAGERQWLSALETKPDAAPKRKASDCRSPEPPL
jgi:5-methylcytosine-specific restriction endonuclease McrA